MKKHAAGIVLFVLIVTLSAVGYALFRTYPIPEIWVVETSEIPNQRTASFPMRHRVKIVQAIASVSDNTLALDLKDNGLEGKDGTVASPTNIVLAYYSVNSDGPRFVRSETIEIKPNQWLNGSAGKTIKYKPMWFGRESVNLYVTACVVGSECAINDVSPFSQQNSAPVLLIARK